MENFVKLQTGFTLVLKSPEICVFILQDLKSPEIGLWCWKSPEFCYCHPEKRR